MTTTLEFPLGLIVIDAEIQVRANLQPAIVEQYVERMSAHESFPPVTLFDDGLVVRLADGHHRLAAAQRLEQQAIVADVHLGTRQEALWFALGANRAHGLQLTDRDTQHALQLALRAYPEKTQKEIALHVGCSQSLVSRVASRTANITGNKSERGRSLVAKQKRDEIRALLQAGVPSVQVRAQLNANSTVIAEVKRELGQKSISYSPAAVEQRRVDMRRMAGEGYRSEQIASAVGLTPARVRLTLKREGVVAPGDVVTRGLHRHDATRIVGRIVMDAENLLAGATLIDFSDLDAAQINDWIHSLSESRAALSTFIKRLMQEQTHGEVA